MTYHTKEIDVARIYLDNENPRHDPVDSEPEIIAHLIAKDGVKPLARNIAEAGTTSPLERIGVIAHPTVKNAYISVEGNRRLCALKLLADPDKADSEANKKYFRALATKMRSLPESIEAVVFKDRASARRWISLRHEGEQGGVGTKQWGADEKARFNNQGAGRKNPNVQAYLLKDYARRKGLLGPQQIEDVNVTTLTRYLSNPVFRAALGLIDHQTLTITVPTEEFDRAVTRFLVDSLDSASSVNSRSDAGSRKAYAEKLRSEGIAPSTRDLPPFDVSTGPRPAAKDERKAEAKKQRNNRSPDARKTVIPRTYSAHIRDKILKRLYDELRELDAENFSFAATYFYKIEDHTKLAKAVASIDRNWMVTYDDAPEIRRLYVRYPMFLYGLNYSAQLKRVGTELMVLAPSLRVPPAVKVSLSEIQSKSLSARRMLKAVA